MRLTKEDICTTTQPLLRILDEFKDLDSTCDKIRNIEKTISDLDRTTCHLENMNGSTNMNMNVNVNKNMTRNTNRNVNLPPNVVKPGSGIPNSDIPKNNREAGVIQISQKKTTIPFSRFRSNSPQVEDKRKGSLPGFVSPGLSDGSCSPFRGRTSTGTRTSLRKRSPSPVVTGKVSSFRSKFESVSMSSNCQSTGLNQTHHQTIKSNKAKFREPHEVLPVSRTSSISRLPAHYVPMASSYQSSQYFLNSSNNRRPSLNRNNSIRRTSENESSAADITSVQDAVHYLRSNMQSPGCGPTSPTTATSMPMTSTSAALHQPPAESLNRWNGVANQKHESSRFDGNGYKNCRPPFINK